jgi:DNA-binding HxlR family transcriptional regulator
MALTKKDTEKLSGIFATKEDLKQFATKKDLEELSTKTDIRFNEISRKFNEVTNTLDKIVGKLETMHTEQIVAREQYRRHDEKLENHEKRIGALEAKPA